ncbi:hypothetical protein [Chelatococcus reniformis]|uniref:UrcA family protein n=1 Tax=Chelatococcus reniformis TaxID=1494448 RepID=A0A916TXG1_9HYPH|nr:hypothetical protein [Chelatococcus reniformis]GGC46623.1 hypothetical protein GCM10010994_02210 [Chelatococcus reniformis]
MTRRRAALFTLLAVAAVPALPAPAAADQSCPRDALVILSAVREARYQLEQAAEGSVKERCKAWQGQVAALKRASAFYARCQTGAERDRSIANANAGVRQFQDAYNGQCTGR